MRLSGLEPETYGLKVVPSPSSQVAAETVVSEAGGADVFGPVQRKAQRNDALSGPADDANRELAEVAAAWPVLSPEDRARVLAIVRQGAN